MLIRILSNLQLNTLIRGTVLPRLSSSLLAAKSPPLTDVDKLTLTLEHGGIIMGGTPFPAAIITVSEHSLPAEDLGLVAEVVFKELHDGLGISPQRSKFVFEK
mmetsp:Transcript_20709/g.48420  ORF Transcript_20709/g.48420 Transcript_20709/m.48420 type:complete len:103 (-) Transcript_20709:100-408(-)